MRRYEDSEELQRVACALVKHLDGLSFNDLRILSGVPFIHQAVQELNHQGFRIDLVEGTDCFLYKMVAGPGFFIGENHDLGAMVRHHHLQQIAVGGGA